MMKYLDPNQSEARDKRFREYVSKGQEMIHESVDVIADVREDFSRWRNLTTALLGALEGNTGNLPPPGQMARSY
jgi:hypothetical protein